MKPNASHLRVAIEMQHPAAVATALAVVTLLLVLATAAWLPNATEFVFWAALVAVFLTSVWLFATWNRSLTGWRRFLVITIGSIVLTGAIALLTIAVLFEYLPVLGYRE